MSLGAPADSVRGVQLRGARLWRLRVNPVFVDWGLAATVTVATQLGIWLGSDAADHRLAAAALAAVMTVPIAVRRRFPLLVGVAVPSVSAVDHALWNPSSIGYPLATFLALYALAVWTRPRPFVVGTALVVATEFLATAATGGALSGTVPFVIVVVVVMVLVRRVVGDRERRADMAERERDVAAREAVLEERSRIARELHDVIAHNVSMMVIQAGAERRDLEGRHRHRPRLLSRRSAGTGDHRHRDRHRHIRVRRRSRADRHAREGRSLRRPLRRHPTARRRLCHPGAAPGSMTTVLIADDQALVRVGLRKILDGEPDATVIGEAADGEDAVREASRLRPDVVLMDIRMPVLDGIEATRRIVQAQPETRVLILTTFGLDRYVFDSLRAGASGFMLKDAPPKRSAQPCASSPAAKRCSPQPSLGR